jgi:hypothetical protein
MSGMIKSSSSSSFSSSIYFDGPQCCGAKFVNLKAFPIEQSRRFLLGAAIRKPGGKPPDGIGSLGICLYKVEPLG